MSDRLSLREFADLVALLVAVDAVGWKLDAEAEVDHRLIDLLEIHGFGQRFGCRGPSGHGRRDRKPHVSFARMIIGILAKHLRSQIP